MALVTPVNKIKAIGRTASRLRVPLKNECMFMADSCSVRSQ
jgi:hypothetical protein